ncbi:bacteriohemerythrin [Geomesophilobacter sediminis]|uniref:Hemerythrin family protein n=1 Tax=Geomesophilobacter sediminis TaxID=2798584 RepID=A0A8J7LW76_9BACT|nr:bacteriohemerythrin [Geomesophilobacter sediminis]MBJ6725485.1 hemerythrin family protein [Geomesophilobacter sediminis]
MSLIAWDDGFLLGVPEFDEHHRHLVGLLNRTYDCFIERQSPDKAETIVNELIDYATYHFNCEERWMVKIGYPGRLDHAKEHQRYIRRIAEIQQDVLSGKKSVTLEMLVFLKNWLTDHILKTDVDYRDFYRKNGEGKGIDIDLGE